MKYSKIYYRKYLLSAAQPTFCVNFRAFFQQMIFWYIIFFYYAPCSSKRTFPGSFLPVNYEGDKSCDVARISKKKENDLPYDIDYFNQKHIISTRNVPYIGKNLFLFKCLKHETEPSTSKYIACTYTYFNVYFSRSENLLVACRNDSNVTYCLYLSILYGLYRVHQKLVLTQCGWYMLIIIEWRQNKCVYVCVWDECFLVVQRNYFTLCL